MKQCLNCKQTKEAEHFYTRSGNRSHELQAVCKVCSKESSNKHKRFISSLTKRWKLRKGCANCSFKAVHSVQLDIDHITPKHKKGNDRQAINTSWSKQRLKKELSNCQVLCANCHRLKTLKDGLMFKPCE